MRAVISSSHLATCLVALAVSTGCKAVFPSNERVWTPDQAVLSHADFDGDQVTVHNIRNCHYRSETDFDVDHYDKTYDLTQLRSVDFLVCPFPGSPSLAHTMLSFGFRDENDVEDYVCVSVEIRKEQGESFAAWKGGLRQYELMYVVGDERDLVQLRTNHRRNEVYLYPARATEQQRRDLFVDVMRRVNKLYSEPEFYDTLTNNCTINIARHVNRLSPGRVPLDYHVLLTGYSDQQAYELGLIDSELSFEQTKLQSRITELAYVHRDRADFSSRIRR